MLYQTRFYKSSISIRSYLFAKKPVVVSAPLNDRTQSSNQPVTQSTDKLINQSTNKPINYPPTTWVTSLTVILAIDEDFCKFALASFIATASALASLSEFAVAAARFK
jgi:hypothetical protein